MNRAGSRFFFLLVTVFCLSTAATSTSSADIVCYVYDPSLGTLPTDQGWTENVDPSANVNLSGGILSVQSTQSGQQSWSRFADPFLFSDGITIEATMRINSSTYFTSPAVRAGYYLGVMDNTSFPVWTSITDTGVYYHYEGEVTTGFVPVTLNDGQFHDFLFVANSSGFDLFIDGTQYIDEPFRTGVWALPNYVSFGDQSNLGQSDVDLAYYKMTVGVPEPSMFAACSILITAFMLFDVSRIRRQRRRCS